MTAGIQWQAAHEARFRESWAAHVSERAIGEEFLVSRQAVVNYAARLGLPKRCHSYTKDQVAQMRAQWVAGEPREKIAKQQGITVDALTSLSVRQRWPSQRKMAGGGVARGVSPTKGTVKLPVVRRKCLCCSKPFDGDKVTFICTPCKSGALYGNTRSENWGDNERGDTRA